MKIIGTGNVTLGMYRDTGMSYTLAPSMLKTYVATVTGTFGAWDMKYLDEYGDFKYRYVEMSSIQAVEDTQGSWWWDSVSEKFYIHCIDDRVPDNFIAPILSLDTVLINSQNTYYFENINFAFGYWSPFTAKGNSTILAKNCSFRYASVSNGFSAKGCKLAILIDCSASQSRADGFNYHHDIATGVSPNFLEINCFGYRNGLESPIDNNNGSTSHDSVRGIRVNTVAFLNKGAQIADVNLSQTWNVGCVAYNSQSITDGFNAGFGLYDVGGKYWLQNCVAYDVINPVFISSTQPSLVYTKNCVFIGTLTVLPIPY